jgi:hypothetical protein
MAGQEFALLIGNATFPQEPKLSPLRCPLHDVDGLKDLLSAPEHGTYSVQTLKDQPSNLVRDQIYRVLREAHSDDLVLLYYSGHGKVDDDGLYLTSVDTRLDSLPTTSVPVSEIKKFVNKSHCDRIILVLDCCFSGAVGDMFRGDVATQVSQILPADFNGRGTYILTASSEIELAEEREGDEYGLLTKHIIYGIKHGTADRDDDGYVSMRELSNYVQAEVRKEGKQTPQGYAIRTQDGDLKLARTGRPPRDQKRREVLRAIYEAGLHSHIPPRVIGPAIMVVDSAAAAGSDAQAANDLLDRLHRVSRSAADFVDALLQLPEAIQSMERPLRSELEQARRRCDQLEAELKTLGEHARQIEVENQEQKKGARLRDEMVQAAEQARHAFETELRARTEKELQLVSELAHSRRRCTELEAESQSRAQRIANLERAASLVVPASSDFALERIKEEMREHKRQDDARRGVYTPAPQPSKSVQEIKAEVEEQKRRDDARRMGR